MHDQILQQCQAALLEWQTHPLENFTFEAPKGFSSFTVTVRSIEPLEPPAVLYRKLEGKENAILDFALERDIFLLLGQQGIAADCYYYDEAYRLEAFFTGRTLTAEDLTDSDNLRKIANALYKFHQLRPGNLPTDSYFHLLHQKWGRQAQFVLEDNLHQFPAHEQALCLALREIYSTETYAKVQQCLPNSPLTFCHNDTYHGNIMRLDSGEIKLLDFEFSCLNHKAFDFSNLFAETVMKHKQPHYPYFRIAEPEFGDAEIGQLLDYYLANETFETPAHRQATFEQLLQDTKDMLPLSHYMYAMAALPLAIEPIQKIRFIPYAHQRFHKFLEAYDLRFGGTGVSGG